MLIAAGAQSSAAVAKLWPDAAELSPTNCHAPADVLKTPPGEWLMFLRTPQPPYRLDDSGSGVIALLELGGCRRLVDPAHGLAGSVGPGVATRLAAIADHPAG